MPVETTYLRTGDSPSTLEGRLPDGSYIAVKAMTVEDQDDNCIPMVRISGWGGPYMYVPISWDHAVVIGSSFDLKNGPAKKLALDTCEARGFLF